MASISDSKRPLIAAFLLFILSPVIGELVIGSIPVSQAAQLIPALGLYGPGALLIRECKIRFSLPWPAIMVAGCAFGIAEEGLALHSFFNPQSFHTDLSFGRAAGINWTWSLFITLYHATWSIAIPIALTEQVFPKIKNKSWIPLYLIAGLALLYAAMLIYYHFLFRSFTGFRASPLQMTITGLLVMLLAVVALLTKRFKKKLFPGIRTPGPGLIFGATFIAAITWFGLFTTIFVPNDQLSPLLIQLAGLAIFGGGILLVYLFRNSPLWSARHTWSLTLAGLVSAACYGALVLSESATGDRIGQAVISLVVITGIWIARR